MENVVFIMISTDGFTAYKNNEYEVWKDISVILNKPADIRYCICEVWPVMSCQSPSVSRNLENVLLLDIRRATKSHKNGGADILFYTGQKKKGKVHLLWFHGDNPAISKIAGLVGHT